ncbi:MAG: response regulator [Spirochaetaceae bacterium]|nr:response regulator [Spirochaetaceae bacterium]
MEKQKILIVEDDSVNLLFLNDKLRESNFEVEKATDGVEALVRLVNYQPDIILLDNLMPKMSGMELVEILKKDPRYKNIPIIILSAIDDAKEKEKGMAMGVAVYLTKPINFDEILKNILTTLKRQ